MYIYHLYIHTLYNLYYKGVFLLNIVHLYNNNNNLFINLAITKVLLIILAYKSSNIIKLKLKGSLPKITNLSRCLRQDYIICL